MLSASTFHQIFSSVMLALLIAFEFALCGGIIYLFILLIKALRKYLKSEPVRKETAVIRRSLGEALKEHRTQCHMTQEFVAEHLGVSRQAVSKWENGFSLS